MKIAVAYATAVLLINPLSRASAADFLNKESCTIEVLATHQQSVYTDCVVRSSMTQGAYDATVTLPNGREFQIENAGSPSFANPPPAGPDPSEIWLLNGRHAQKTGATARPCYQDARTKICLNVALTAGRETVTAEKYYLACKEPVEAATARRRISEVPNGAREIRNDELEHRGCVSFPAGAQVITDGVDDVGGDTFTRVHVPGEAEEYWIVGPDPAFP